MNFVEVIHPDIAIPARVPVSALDHYRSLGWRLPDDQQTPADRADETPTEEQ
ncbi:MAG TPA: hypothetical protein VN088_16235 [Nocardioides sp.]|nr:hypothetical protein [Nocardioides sp.]